MGEVSSGNLLGTRKLTEKSIDRSCVESWNQLFQFGEQNGDKT